MLQPGNSVESRSRLLQIVGICAALALCAAIFAVTAPPARSADPYTVESDVPYGPANDQPGSNLLDIYVPKRDSARPRPVFVWIHGGGWFTGDKVSSTMRYKAKALVNAGFVFVSINYRLSPDLAGPRALSRNRLRYPTHYLDAARALGWVNRNIAEYGGNPERLVIGGDSAGGQISSLLATKPAFLKARGVSTGQIKGVLALDAVGYDVPRMMTPAYRRINAGFQRMMFNAFGTPAEERRSPHWASASPINFADRSDPPIFFVVPTTAPDRWVDAHKMAARLGQRLGLVSHRVRTQHAGVVPLLGNPHGDMGVTAPLMRFARAAVDPVRYRPVIRGSRVVRATGESKLGKIRLRITSEPRARQLTCRIDRGRETLCPRFWRLDPGLHTLRVNAYGYTGRSYGRSVVKLRVTR
ncbi:MAG: alpha/beta hydrolase [Solirubrobacterales bacterium]|nr:alpha/beta hydrolase [Solirubrobacterales bacterium]MCB8915072.1 alpha/beta hydrolase [Thermoleophilales bacterium]